MTPLHWIATLFLAERRYRLPHMGLDLAMIVVGVERTVLHEDGVIFESVVVSAQNWPGQSLTGQDSEPESSCCRGTSYCSTRIQSFICV